MKYVIVAVVAFAVGRWSASNEVVLTQQARARVDGLRADAKERLLDEAEGLGLPRESPVRISHDGGR